MKMSHHIIQNIMQQKYYDPGLTPMQRNPFKESKKKIKPASKMTAQRIAKAVEKRQRRKEKNVLL